MKNAVVTGGGSGIGAGDRQSAARRRLSRRDARPEPVRCRVRLHRRRHRPRRDRRGPDRDPHPSWVRSSILVNAAGLDGFKQFHDIDFERWQRVIDVNLNGVFHCIQAVLPDMVEAGWGRIVNISSSSTHSGTPYMAPLRRGQVRRQRTDQDASRWSTGRAASRSTPCRRASSTPRCCARPQSKRLPRRHRQDHRTATPVRRIGKPEDIAAACAFLISEEAGYITGQILGVNGGRNT